MKTHKNRVPTRPNRRKITPENGAAYYAVVERADEPTEEGTVVNKEMLDEFLAASGITAGSGTSFTLAQDGFSLFDGALVRVKLNRDMVAGATLNVNGTGAKVIVDGDGNAMGTWLKSGAWVDLVYNSATGKYVVTGGAGERHKPGDVLLTARNPGSEWVLCNGDEISASTYPDLKEHLPTTGFSGKWVLRNLATGYSFEVTSIATNGTYWVAAGGNCIFYTTNITGVWTAKVLNLSNAKIKYLNGYFVAFGGSINIMYAINPGGTWTSVQVGSGSYYPVKDITYGNGTWMAVTYYISESDNLFQAIFYSTSLSSGWERGGSSAKVGTVCEFANGYFVMPNASGYAYCETPNGSWRNITWGSFPIAGITYYGGYWWIVGTGIAYATSITGSWKSIDQFSSVSLNTIKVKNSMIVAIGSKGSANVMISGTSPSGLVLTELTGIKGSLRDVDMDAENCVCALNGGVNTPQICSVKYNFLQLPNIELPGVKAYMKAKK